LEEAWNYLIHLSIWWIEKDFIFIEWDEKVYTKNDNILEIINPWFIYPTWKNWEHFDISSVGNLSFDKDNDLILSVPIKSLEITKDWDLINIILKYYRNYNCYNLGENENKVETVIGKISLK
jgi:hypothetical protein